MIEPGLVRQEARRAAALLGERIGETPAAAVILGSGWSALADGRDGVERLGFEEIPGFPATTAPGHPGAVRALETSGGRLLVQEGRTHCYEGLTPLEVSFPVWVYAEMGVKALVMLSAGGGLNPAFIPGDLVIVSDHISLLGPNPLAGVRGEGGHACFAAGSDIYPERWKRALRECLPAGARVERGVYAWVPGPSYETPAEATMLRLLGADVTGMSTVPEAIAGSFLGMDVAALVCVANSLIPPPAAPPAHDDVLEVVAGAAGAMGDFLERLAATSYMLL